MKCMYVLTSENYNSYSKMYLLRFSFQNTPSEIVSSLDLEFQIESYKFKVRQKENTAIVVRTTK